MKIFRIIVLILAGLGFWGFGLWFLFDPITPLKIIGIQVSGEAAPIEFRAFYGGLEIALGIYLIACGLSARLHTPGLWLTLLSNAGIGLVRLASIAVSGQWADFFAYALIWEIGFAILAAIGLFSWQRKVS